MRWLLALLALALLSAGASACGGGSTSTRSASAASPTTNASGGVPATASAATGQPRLKVDADNDNDNPGRSHYDEDDNAIVYLGHAASAADRRAITALIKRYYQAAAASDGVTACALIYSLMAESVAEEYRPALRGGSCGEVMSKLFARNHRLLAGEVATLRVTIARVKDKRGMAVLTFGKMREARMPLYREHGAWKIGALLDLRIP